MYAAGHDGISYRVTASGVNPFKPAPTPTFELVRARSTLGVWTDSAED